MCWLEVGDPFGFLGHVVAGGSIVRWSALSNKLLSSAGPSPSLRSTSPRLGPPLLSVCLSVSPPHPHHTYHMHVLSARSACLWCGHLHLYLNQL